MSTIAPHTFSWVDLVTTDTAAAKSFYSSLFGWTFADQEHDGQVVYSMISVDGKDVAGINTMQPAQSQAGVPSHWQSYVAVEDSDATVGSVEAGGGSVLMPVMDVFDAGRMATLRDPQGAPFCIWQGGTHAGAALFNAPGSLTWSPIV